MEIFKESDLEGFRDGDIVVNCKTEELAKEFINWCFKNDIGGKVNNISEEFNQHKEFTCFRNGWGIIMFDHISYYELQGYITKEFKGFNQTKSTKTLLEYFMELHNLQESEEFSVNGHGRYRIIDNETEILEYDNKWRRSFISATDLNMLEISKLVWKPKKGEEYYYLNLYSTNPILTSRWNGGCVEETLFERGLIHKTKEDVEKRLEEIIALNGK